MCFLDGAPEIFDGSAPGFQNRAHPSIERESTELKSGLSADQIQSVPLGQEYRDILKLLPGVQYSQDAVRGPSAGGSGQDNVYKFEGVNVTGP